MDYVTFVYKNRKYKIPENELIQYLVLEDNKKEYSIFWQRDPRWKNLRLGFGRTTIGTHGCFITSLGMMVHKRPDEVNEILKNNGGFYKDLVKSPQAAKALGLDYNGRDYDINHMPTYSPSIKEVWMGRSQHFVLRIIENGKRYIIDPWTGRKEYINKYPFRSYRLFKQRF
ncbi:MAG: hypothetical protein GF347_00040 [Candidatus Moranbacteria bacterium]|nr:hypothetical protein [Candidatus Moranbacteria bacterium]